MHARVVVGVGKGVLFREVSSVQRCPYREVPLYSETSLIRTPVGQKKVSFIERCPHFRG